MGEKPIMNGDENAEQPNEEPQSVEELRDDIEETRNEMSATIDAIQEKLNPERIKENVAESIHDATVGKARDIAHTVSEKAQELTEKAREAAAPVVQKIGDAVHHKNGNGHSNGHSTDVKPNSGPLKPTSEQVVVIMGASSGIGRESALQFAKRGAKVVVAARGKSALDSLVEDIQNLGGEAMAVVADTADFEQVKSVADQAATRFGRIDTWVHASAISLYAKFEDTTPDEFRRILEVNLLGQIHGALAALPHLRREGRGTLIHISSVESEMSLPLQSAYACSKHGMVGFMDSLRMELQNEGVPIYVADVKPAGINTPLFEHARTKIGVKPQPAPPIYQPSVVAEVILHAAENPTREITAGGAAQMMILGRRLSPSLVDTIMSRYGIPSQKTNQPKSEDAPDNMFEPQDGHGRVGGDFGKSAKGTSMGNFIELHPAARRALKGVALVAALYVLTRNRRS